MDNNTEVAATTKRILIVDDESHIIEVVRTCLEMLGGWDVISATSGREGLVKAQVECPDAILLDVMMPEMDGFVFLRQLHSNPAIQNIPVILLTAKARMIDPEEFPTLGIQGAIAKPFHPIALTNEVAKAFGWSLAE
ncbi:MAG TPA: response regulator [Cyanobacteria bacterium UBA8803]|nr:response regulator [Cyanobacteria bacterium UBA9273]HBL57468.1 response regulator [Cyanobacteria bacterium UBA8803]